MLAKGVTPIPPARNTPGRASAGSSVNMPAGPRRPTRPAGGIDLSTRLWFRIWASQLFLRSDRIFLGPGDLAIVEVLDDGGLHHFEVRRDVEVARREQAVVPDVHDLVIAVVAAGRPV